MVVALVAVLTIGVSRRVAVPIEDAWLTDPDRLVVVVNTCNGDPEVTDLREDDDAVYVRVVSLKTWGGGGDDCLDSIDIHLDEPLDNRTLFDLTAQIRVDLGALLWG